MPGRGQSSPADRRARDSSSIPTHPDSPRTASRRRSSRHGVRGGLDAAALLFFPLLVLLPRGVAALASVAGLCAAGLVSVDEPKKARPQPQARRHVARLSAVCGEPSRPRGRSTPLRSLAVAARLAGLFAAGLALAAAAGSVAAPRRLTILLLVGIGARDRHGGDRARDRGGSELAFLRPCLPGNPAQPGIDLVCAPRFAGERRVGFARAKRSSAVAACSVGRRDSLRACRDRGESGAARRLADGLACSTASRPVVARPLLLSRSSPSITAPLTFARLERLPGLGEAADDFKISAGHRLLIWSFAGDRIAERPLIGWGLDASRAIPGGDDPIRPGESWMPLHPHNAALQLWLELGVPGAVLFALLAALALARLAARSMAAPVRRRGGRQPDDRLRRLLRDLRHLAGMVARRLVRSRFFWCLVMARVANRAAAPPRCEVARTR